MTLKEILKGKGLDDKQVEEVLAEMKTNKIFTASEENLDIRFGKLKGDHEALTAEHQKSVNLIAELQKATAGQADVQKQIGEYQTQIETLKQEAVKAKTESALKVGLLSAGAKPEDIDYLMFKISNDSDFKVELDDHGQVKGLDDKVKGLKTQFPGQFETSSKKTIEEKKLEKTDDPKPTVTKEAFDKMGYKSRMELHDKNPELYAELTK